MATLKITPSSGEDRHPAEDDRPRGGAQAEEGSQPAGQAGQRAERHAGEDGHHPHGQPERQTGAQSGRDLQHAGDGRLHGDDDRHLGPGNPGNRPATATPSSAALQITAPEPPPKRLPRYKRAPREVAFALTRRDVEILKTVKDFRLLTSAHIQALADGSNQGVLRRLQKLYHAGYLDRLSPRTRYGEGSAKMIYAVTNHGVRTLHKAGLIADPTTTDWNFQNRTLHDFSIHHTLLIAHIRTALTAACKTHRNMRLLFWREGPATQDAIEVALPEGYRRIPIAPDAYFALEDAKGRMHLLCEADRGTMTVKRFHLKLKAYAAYWREKKHHDKLGIRNFRVLTVTSSDVRCKNLAAAVEGDEDLRPLARMFLFTEEQKLCLSRPQTIFEPIWRMPGHTATISCL